MLNQSTWPRNAGSIPLVLDVAINDVFVSGLQPSVEVFRHPDNFVADWATLDFVAPGTAASGQAAMSGLQFMPGVYRRDFDPDQFGEGQNLRQVYLMKYRVVIPSGHVESVVEDVELVSHEVHAFVGSPELTASFDGD